jgi:sodium/bile acid cotransporter 7
MSTNFEKAEAQLQYYTSSFSDIPIISAEEIVRLQRERKIILVDVRTDVERQTSFIPNSISQTDFEELISSLNDYNIKDQLIVPYCTIGYRSGKYCRKLQNLGIKNIQNGEGIIRWTYIASLVKAHNGEIEETKDVHVFLPSLADTVAEDFNPISFSTFELIQHAFMSLFS